MPDAFFGSPVQQALQRRAAAMWTLLRDDPDYSCHGRVVAVSGQRPDTVQQQIALARLQGVAPSDGVTSEAAPARRIALKAAGLVLDEYTQWEGDEDAVAVARRVLADRSLPGGMECLRVDAETPVERLRQLDAVTRSCDVLLPMARFLRNLERPATCLYAQDGEGRVVAAAAAVAQFHPDSPQRDEFWWGMLATDDSCRGQGIAHFLGAAAIVRMADDRGVSRFHTGIRAGNIPSERLCAKLGLRATDRTDMIAIDPQVFEDGNLTR